MMDMPDLSAHIDDSNYEDSLPLHRQEDILNSSGIELSRAESNYVSPMDDRLQQKLYAIAEFD